MAVNRLFELLEDGQWHDFSEVVETINLQEQPIEHVLHFFIKFGFIQFDPSRKRVSIDSAMKELFQQEAT